MKFSSGFLKSIFGESWTIETREDCLIFQVRKGTKHLDYMNIHGVRLKQGLISSALVLNIKNHSFEIGGLSRKQAETILKDLESCIRSYIARCLERKNIASQTVSEGLQQFLESDRYISQMDVRQWLSTVDDIGPELSHPYFDINNLTGQMRQGVKQIADISQEDSALLRQRNERYIEKAMVDHAGLFNRLEKYPLTIEQIRAAVVDEDRNLLVAAAGSGKSSTVIAKVAYLLERKLADPHEILVLAYNKDAQVELDRRVAELAAKTNKPAAGVSAKTFHGLGVEILAEVEGTKVGVAELATAGRHRRLQLFNEMVEELRLTDPDFSRKWRQFQLFAKHGSLDLFQIRNRKEYNDYLLEMGARWRHSPQGMRLVIQTMDGKEVKSLEEVKIANWLMVNGVRYEYERRYEHETTTQSHRQYCPDFYYPEIDVYHEHFALNTAGEAPPFMGKTYLQGVEWKRNLHLENKTSLYESFSAEFQSGTVFECLKKMLIKRGITLKPLSDDEIDQRIQKNFDPETDTEIFSAVLKHFKANNAEIDWLRHKAKESFDAYRTRLFIDLFEKIHADYQRRLGDEIDFEDQINKACTYLEERRYVHPYKYVLVDEAQDMSQDRKRMINALLGQKGEVKLFAVGDDWQSIYRFSGADIDIMINFPDHFGHTSRNFLTQTFRSHQGIVDVAATFIQRNPNQFRKEVNAHSDLPGDLVIINEYTSTKDRDRLIEYRLDQIHAKAKHSGQRLSVFLLARYHRHKPTRMARLIEGYPFLDLSFKTVHASKGLEADYVLLLEVNSGRYGFPSRIVDDPLLQLVIPRPETFPDAEERRLFYVAITRAKIAVLIFTDTANVSPFIKELAEISRVKGAKHLRRTEPCPNCATGELKLRKGKLGLFWGCSNYPECKFTETAACPECKDGRLVERTSGRGVFYGCSRYPKCQATQKQGQPRIAYRPKTQINDF